jgi:hypothetical protein
LPQGATPDGVLDLAGNVHEWTSSIARAYPYRADDGREDPDRVADRVVRGGAADTGPQTLTQRMARGQCFAPRHGRPSQHRISLRQGCGVSAERSAVVRSGLSESETNRCRSGIAAVMGFARARPILRRMRSRRRIRSAAGPTLAVPL